MVLKAKGRLFRRKDGKYLLYVPKDLGQDSQFPFSGLQPGDSVKVFLSVNTVQKILLVTEAE